MGQAALVKYYAALDSYISERDFDLMAFYTGFQRAANLS